MDDTGSSGGDLDALLQQHKVQIDGLRQRLGDVLVDECDDVWLLRFVLSNGSVDAAEEPARFTIQWRKDRQAVLAKLKAGEDHPLHNKVTKFQVASSHKTTLLGEPVFYVRIGLCNPRALMDAIAFDDVVEYYMMSREQLLIQCDHESRKKRTLIKILSVLDFTGFSIARGHDSRFSQMLGVTSKLSEKMFPQLLGRTIFINVPQVFQWVFRLIKPLMSHRTVAKMVICPGASSGQSLAACPFTQHHLGVDNIPTFLGGTCRCNGGCCIGGVPNSQTTPINSVDADGLASISLSARTTQSLDYPVGADMHVSYNIIAEGKAIDVRAFISANGLTGDTKDAVALWECPMLQAADGVQAGTWVMPHDGILTLRIDNRHALFRGRSIKVKLDFVGRDESNVAQDDPLEMKRGGEGVDRVGALAHPDSKDS